MVPSTQIIMACAEDMSQLNKTTMAPTDMFGHFLLPFTTNKGDIDAKKAEYIKTVRGHFLELKKDRPERHALRNLLGMLAFQLTNFEEALEYMDKILSQGEDTNNLNALANCRYICNKLFRFQEARYYKQRIHQLLTCDSTEESQDRCKRLRARSLAEQAFAYSFELFGESVTVKRYRKSVELYEQAAKLAGSLVDIKEKEDWTSVCGMACHKIYNNSKYNKEQEGERKEWFQKAVKNFMLIVQYSKDKPLLGESWRHLGELFQESADLRPSLPEEMKKYAKDPEECFEEALVAQPEDSRILARYAKHLNRKRKFEDAMRMIDASIDMDGSQYNFHAYDVRASFRIAKFKRLLKCYPKCRLDFNLLSKAEKDLKIVFELTTTPWLLLSMAEVYYYMGLDFSSKGVGKKIRSQEKGQKNIQLALTYCAKAAACQDGMKRPDVHEVRGNCLCAMDEHEAALGSFKRALECARPSPNSTKYGQRIVDEFEHVLRETKSLPVNSPTMANMLYWLHGIAEDHISNNQTLNLWKLKNIGNHWSTFVEYCKTNHSEGKLATIQKAGEETGRSIQSPAHRQLSVPTAVETPSQLTSVQRLQSLPGSERERGVETRRMVEIPDPARDSDVYSPTPESHESEDTFNMTSGAPKDAGGNLRDRSQMTTTSSSAGEVPDVIYVTYEVETKTGKTLNVSTTPPASAASETVNAVSTRNIRDPPERPLNCRQMKYDFFVIYSDSAAEWVHHRMLEELEGVSSLKGCIKDRDFDLGKVTFNNYTESIKDSDCIIVVITEDFEKSENDFRAMISALHLKKFVIPVMREYREMPMGLADKPCLDARGAVDWSRLIRSIEQGIKLDATSDDRSLWLW